MNLLRGRFFLLGKRFCAGFADFNGWIFLGNDIFNCLFFALIPNFSEAFFLFLAVF